MDSMGTVGGSNSCLVWVLAHFCCACCAGKRRGGQRHLVLQFGRRQGGLMADGGALSPCAMMAWRLRAEERRWAVERPALPAASARKALSAGFLHLLVNVLLAAIPQQLIHDLRIAAANAFARMAAKERSPVLAPGP